MPPRAWCPKASPCAGAPEPYAPRADEPLSFGGLAGMPTPIRGGDIPPVPLAPLVPWERMGIAASEPRRRCAWCIMVGSIPDPPHTRLWRRSLAPRNASSPRIHRYSTQCHRNSGAAALRSPTASLRGPRLHRASTHATTSQTRTTNEIRLDSRRPHTRVRRRVAAASGKGCSSPVPAIPSPSPSLSRWVPSLSRSEARERTSPPKPPARASPDARRSGRR